jgi:hypothetical protein
MKTLIIIDNRIWGKVKDYATVEEISVSSAVEVLLKKALNESRDEVKVEGRVPQEMDIVGRNQFFLFQIKIGDIGIPIWRKVIYGQLTQLYCRPYLQTYSNEMAPRRIILITSGTFTEEVKAAIKDWNSKIPIPVEAFSGRQFARLLDERYNVKASEIDGLIKRRNIVKL